jgi:ferredoxin-like protein FixX
MNPSGKSHLLIRVENLKEYGLNMDLADKRKMKENQGVIDLNGAPFYVLVSHGENILSCLQCHQMRVDTPEIKLYYNDETMGIWYKKNIKRVYVDDEGVELTLNED